MLIVLLLLRKFHVHPNVFNVHEFKKKNLHVKMKLAQDYISLETLLEMFIVCINLLLGHRLVGYALENFSFKTKLDTFG